MRRRVLRINDLLRREIGELLLHQAKDPRVSAFVSITEVKTSSDLRYARVFVSILGSQEERQEALTGLRSATKFLRHELAGRLSLRQIPELSFHRDDSIERGARILSILQELAPAPTDGPTET